MDFNEVVQLRHSVRSYRPDPLPPEILQQMLEAARIAPSAQNRQPWRFIVLQDSAKIKELSLHSGFLGMVNLFIRQAPCVIVACADTTGNLKINEQDYYLVDTAIAFHQMMLTAWSFGIGSCWLAAFNEKKLASWLKIPPAWRIVALSPFGYPAEKPGIYAKLVKTFAGSKDRLPLDKIVRYID